MAKKRNKYTKRAMAARASQARASQATEDTLIPTTESQAGGEVDFATEYRYVLGDLKRFAILAGAMFAALLILALVF